MAGLVAKLIICPIVVYLSAALGFIRFSVTQAVVVGLILAVTSHVMELYLLRAGTLFTSSVMDFTAATLILIAAGLLLPTARVTVLGAASTAFLLALTETVEHWWLIRSGRTIKSPEDEV